jgi:SAM-dependent methyltransferase
MRRAVIAFSIRNRTKKAQAITKFMDEISARNAIFVGCSPGTNPNEAIVEKAVADRAEILVACDILECEGLPWPFVKADGRDLPFPDDYTDLVLANAVIEHVGNLEDQLRFVVEQSRVGKAWVITTPNRWFPIEAHTSAVLRHWSRKWRDSRTEFTRLLSLQEFRDLLPAGARVEGHAWSPTFTAYYRGAAAAS